ncbi:Ubiquitin carboxyl-terminal hydrolase MINDY-1 [Perkinsus chesapeaki]|uniref:Ubiquitin carboxyl-terminal hydrolase MINDY-1 n=1 Tax=Perkinsus chesapeaki TaxID=330153 RepID=A0A7J6LV94_PERCH|nr:Ubiquitin carboxyl-terminal hydrolase MINDY-1 [Perkinsus chesapeaki]
MSTNPPPPTNPAAQRGVSIEESVPMEAPANAPPAEAGTQAAQLGSAANPVPAVVVAQGVPLPGQEGQVPHQVPQEDMSSPIPNHYRIKHTELLGSERSFLLQSENGPCPLLAVANVLLLRNKLQLHKDMSSISFDDLVSRIANVMFDANQGGQDDVAQGLEDAVTLLPSLNKGLDVNVKFGSCDGFEFTPELGVFDLLDITLLHGWVVSKDDMSAFPVLGALSYNQAIEKVVTFNDMQAQALEGREDGSTTAEPGAYEDGLIVSQWLDDNKSQMTYDGLSQIMEKLRDNELAVLFRNNHFVTVFKPSPDAEGETHLYALATDIGFGSSSVVWERLDTLDGDTLYYDAQFHRATGQSPASRQALNAAEQDPDYLLALSLQMDDDERARRRPQTYVGPMGVAMVTDRNDGNQQGGRQPQEGERRRKKKFCAIISWSGMQYLFGRRRGSIESLAGSDGVREPEFIAAVHPGLEYISQLSPLNRLVLMLKPPGRSGQLPFDKHQRSVDAATVGRACAPHIRVAAIKQLPETCYSVGYEEAAEYILPLVLARLAADPDPTIRQALLDTVGELAAFLILSDPDQGYSVVVRKLFPIVAKILVEDKSSEVRTKAAAAISTLAVHMRSHDHGETVLTTLLRMSQTPANAAGLGALGDDDNDVQGGQSYGTAATAAVQLMGHLSSTLGPEICSQYIVAQLNSLTEERCPKVRRAVAGSMAEVAAVVGPTLTLTKIYPFFSHLTQDPHWAVRKSAFDSMHLFLMELLRGAGDHDVNGSSPQTDSLLDKAVCELLTAMAEALVSDTSWWVRKAAMLKVGYVIAACGPLMSHKKVFEIVDPLVVQFSDLILSHSSSLSQLSSRDSTSGNKHSEEGTSLGGAELSREVLFHSAFTFAGVARSVLSGPQDPTVLWSERFQRPLQALLYCSDSKVRRPIIASLHFLITSCGDRCQEVFEDCTLAVIQILAAPQGLAEERILLLRDAVEVIVRRLEPKSVLTNRILRVLTTIASATAAASPRSRSSMSLSSMSSRGDDKNITVTDTTGWRQKGELAKTVRKLIRSLGDVEGELEDSVQASSVKSLMTIWLTLLGATTPPISRISAQAAPEVFKCVAIPADMKRRTVAFLVKKFASSKSFSKRHVFVELCKQVLIAALTGDGAAPTRLSGEARYFLTLLATTGHDACVHIRQAVASALSALSPFPASCPDDILEIIHTLQEDDDREVKRCARGITVQSIASRGGHYHGWSLDWALETGYELLPSAPGDDYTIAWVVDGDDHSGHSSPPSPAPQHSSSSSSFDGGTGSSDHGILDDDDDEDELHDTSNSIRKSSLAVDSIHHCDTPRSVPGRHLAGGGASSFYIGAEDSDNDLSEEVPDADDFTVDDCRELDDESVGRLPLPLETSRESTNDIEDVFDQTDWTTATLSPSSRGISFDESPT